MFSCIFYYSKTIQDSDEGHSSVEDAVTTMELVKLKLQQCELNIYKLVNLKLQQCELNIYKLVNLKLQQCSLSLTSL
jgi:hypothetical protein